MRLDESDIGVVAHRFYMSREGKLMLVHTVTESDPIAAFEKHVAYMNEWGYDVRSFEGEVRQLNNMEAPL